MTLSTVSSTNVTLSASDEEPEYDNMPMLLADFDDDDDYWADDVADPNVEILDEDDMAAYMDAYRASQDHLLGRTPQSSTTVPLTSPDDMISDGASSDTESSSGDVPTYDTDSRPGLLGLFHLYALIAISSILGVMEYGLEYMSGSKDSEPFISSSYMATKGNRMTDDNTMIVDCGAT